MTVFSGEVGNQTCDSHCGLPAPGGSTCADAAAGDHAHIGMIANDGNGLQRCSCREATGDRLFLSRTMECSSMRCAVSNPPSTSTTLF